ncbi:MAG: hypothetical protein II776_06280 [Clostridia bacterium]|nr:hypothetical protein [Clostridia bacterium]
MDQIKIGWGRREISTDLPVNIPGQIHMRVNEGIMDPLYATALAVDGGEGQDAFIFVSCDITNLRRNAALLAEQFAREMEPSIPENCIVLNATHTHTSIPLVGEADHAPDGAPVFPGDQYRTIFAMKAAMAAVDAWRSRKPGGIAFGYGYAVAGHSRRVCYFEDMSKVHPNAVAPNGKTIMYGNTNDPLFSHYEAGADHFLNCLFTVDDAERLTGMIVNVPCPSQTGEQMFRLSADFWNEVRAGVAKEYGEDVFVLPQCAAAGDLAPRILHYRKAQARRHRLKYGLEYDWDNWDYRGENYLNRIMSERMDIAERILDGVRDVWSWAQKDVRREVRVRHKCETISLKLRKITPEEKAWCEENIREMEKAIPSDKEGTPDQIRRAVSRYNTIKNRNTDAIARYEKQGEDPRTTTVLHTASLDEAGFCFNCFEMYMDFMHRIQARSPFIQTFVTQLATTSACYYLPTKRGEEGKGYSASIFCNSVGAEGGQELVEETLRALNELKEN